MKKISFLIICVISIVAISCQKEKFVTDPFAKLRFSTDTVLFDTVFTTIGSTTKRLKVYNDYKETLRISEIKLGQGSLSNFRINVDGKPTDLVKNIEILPKDSMYIFVEVTVDPNRDKMLEQDSIIFRLNENIYDIDLVAFGQDVNLINGEILNTQTWTKEKPYLIYSYVWIDTLQTLTVEAGTTMYFHRGSNMYVQGTLNVQGTMDEPVKFLGDRLEYMYFDEPSQWNGIIFVNGSKNNFINYGIINNAVTAIQLGTLNNDDFPDLHLSNTRIEHHSFTGIMGIGATLLATNCVISNCGTAAVYLSTGGNYKFFHCTLANYWHHWGYNRSTPSCILTNYLKNGSTLYHGVSSNFYFGNSIIDGNQENEFAYDIYENGGTFTYLFENCLVKVNNQYVNTNNPLNFKDCLINKKAKYIDEYNYNYELDTLSDIKDKGKIEIINQYPQFLQTDINGTLRNTYGLPDLGAHERKEATVKK